MSAFIFHRRYSNRVVIVNAPFFVEEDEFGHARLHVINGESDIHIAETPDEVANLVEARGLAEPPPLFRPEKK